MIIIGERINATRKSIAQAINDGDEAHIAQEITSQDEANADYIDLNGGTDGADREHERANMAWLIDVALRHTEKKLSLDSSDPEVLASALGHLDGRREVLLNSVTGEPARLEQTMPLAAKHRCPIIALAMDAEGIPASAERRLAVCAVIAEAAEAVGVPHEHLFFDPLVLPVCSDVTQVGITLETLRRIKARFPQAKTTMGVSNVSHGLPKRTFINEALLIASLATGLDSGICDPTRAGIRRAIALGDLLAGKDRHCRRYSRQVRKGDI